MDSTGSGVSVSLIYVRMVSGCPHFFRLKFVGLEIIVYLCPRIINCTEDVYNNIIV